MLQRLALHLRNLVYKNRRTIKAGNRLELPASSERNLKKVTIKLGGRNNRLIIGENVKLTHCEIRLDGEDNLIEIGANVRFSSGKIYLRGTRGQHIRFGADTTVEGAYLLVDEAASIDIGRDCRFLPISSSVPETSTRSSMRRPVRASIPRGIFASPIACGSVAMCRSSRA